jgi:hypothetical protein
VKEIPFARWPDFAACKREMMDEGHDEDSAKRICGAIQARSEKGELYKAVNEGLDIISKGDELVVGGYSSWELQDPQGDVITTKGQVGWLTRFLNLPPEYRGTTVKHGDFRIGTVLHKFTKPNGETVYTHVNEIGTYLITKIRNDNFLTTKLWREAILRGELGMYSISGLPLPDAVVYKEEHGERVRYIYDLEPWAPTLCEHGVNPKAQTEVIAKEMKAGTLEKLKAMEKMSWEECIAEASKDPNVTDPEKLCGWLRAHGPNAKSQGVVPVERGMEVNKDNSELEEIFQKHGFGLKKK